MKLNLTFIGVFVAIIGAAASAELVGSFKDLAKFHCANFDIEMLWRMASGRLSEKYGENYFDFDCYIRQFVREDGIARPEADEDEEDDEEEQSQEENQQNKEETIPEVDPIVIEYATGLTCLPEGVDTQKATYQIWRFFRFVIQHDYALEWMRAKIRAGLGYEAERPNAWMDGEHQAERLRLDKLFSNQFYDYVDKLMFKDFLYPVMTFLKKNTVLALSGELTESGKPILVQSIQTHNYLPEIFKPVVLSLEGQSPIFSYTLPGLPLLLGGSTGSIAWGFTGVLVDRSNVEEIEIVGDKFYNHDTEEWIKLNSEEIQLTGSEGRVCKFITSPYGALYTKRDSKGKVQEYIATWHEDQAKVRVIFSELLSLVQAEGVLPVGRRLEFPFNSLVLANNSGIFQYLCPQEYPSYFLYPDMFGEPEEITERWVTYPARKYVIVSNTLLTTMKQQSYFKGEPQSPLEERIGTELRKPKTKYTQESALQLLEDAAATLPQVKKQKNIFMQIYRKVKFFYLPQADIRKECDQLVSLLEKWNEDLRDEQLAPIYRLWEYFVREFTFNYVSSSDFGLAIAKHKIISEHYWVGQMTLWQKGTSYGECDSNAYDEIRASVNGTGHNSSCYLNIVRGLNATRQVLFQKYDGDLSKINLSDFLGHQILDISQGPAKGSHVEEAFGVHYSRNLWFAAELGNPKILYHTSYKETQQEAILQKKPETIEEGEL